MSRSILYGAEKKFTKFRPLKEYQNSWGTFPMVLDLENIGWGKQKDFDIWHEKLCAASRENDIYTVVKIIHTYYPVLFHRSMFSELQKSFTKLHDEIIRNGSTWSHYETIAKDIAELPESIEYATIKGTRIVNERGN